MPGIKSCGYFGLFQTEIMLPEAAANEQTMKKPLVSIILTTYNGGQFLEEQLASLFQQTYPNIEIIAVDDGSTDHTVSILHRQAQQHACLKVFQNEQNLGFIKNFERGCRLSSGHFLAFCDQDDYWMPDKIEKMVAAIGHAPMIYCDSILCDANLQSLHINISDRVIGIPVTSPLQQAVFGRIYGHAILFTRELFQKADPFFDVITHDWWISYMATLHGGIAYLPQPLILYRQHASNVYGAIGGKSRKKESKSMKAEKKKQELQKIRARMDHFYQLCPDDFPEKAVLRALALSYRSFSLRNNWNRMLLFFRYRHQLLAVKKRSPLRKTLFCLKMFTMIK